MKKAFFAIAIFATSCIFFKAYAQPISIIEPPSNSKNFKEADLDKVAIESKINNDTESLPNDDLVDILLGKNKLSSLMFDEEELDNVDKAIFALKNGEIYTAEDYTSDLGNKGLSVEEKLKLEKEKREKEKSENNERSYIYLASIMYLSKDDWTAWINNSKITSALNNRNNEFFVKKINGEQADILWTLSLSKWRALSGKASDTSPPNINEKNQVEIGFTLKPNQTFILKLNFIAEGKNVNHAIFKKEEKIRKDLKKRVNN